MTIKKKIVIATGGTGGHVFPALALSNYLKNDYAIEIFSDKRGLKYFKKQENINLIHSSTIFQRNIFKIIINFFKILLAIINSFFSLKKIRPDLVFGMGGYSSFPLCFASYLLKIPFLIYENNYVIGKANKILLPLSYKILVSSSDIEGIKEKYKKKLYVSGYLLRNEIYQKSNMNKINKKLSILIIGGSQSAQNFGKVLPKIIEKCKNKGIEFKVNQQCLDNQISEIEKIYKNISIDFNLFSFSESLEDYYAETDLAITRSGASSIAELINLRIPFIAIPLPSSADNHQLKNAQNFEKKGYCYLLEEKYIFSKLFGILEDLNKNREKLSDIQKNMRKHSDKDAIFKIKKLIEEFFYEKN